VKSVQGRRQTYLTYPGHYYLELFIPFIRAFFVSFSVNCYVLTETVLYRDRAVCRWMLALNIPDSAKLPW